jgi:probable addiction module antidote protein
LIAAFIAKAFESGNTAYIAYAPAVVARARGMAQIASETWRSSEQLYRLSRGICNPTLKATTAVMNALGKELIAKVVA